MTNGPWRTNLNDWEWWAMGKGQSDLAAAGVAQVFAFDLISANAELVKLRSITLTPEEAQRCEVRHEEACEYNDFMSTNPDVECICGADAIEAKLRKRAEEGRAPEAVATDQWGNPVFRSRVGKRAEEGE